MTNPVHKLKKYVIHEDGNPPPYWYDTDAVGWLSTGIADYNGVEIFEGSKVKIWLAEDFTIEGIIEWDDAAFKVADCLLTDIESMDIEVIGHVAEGDSL